MWEEFGNKVVVKEWNDWHDVDWSYKSYEGSLRTFKLSLFEKVEGPTGDNDPAWLDETLFCVTNKKDKIIGWYREFKEVEFTMDLKECWYIDRARKIANDIARENSKQLYFDISSTIKNEFGEFPVLVKKQVTKKYPK